MSRKPGLAQKVTKLRAAVSMIRNDRKGRRIAGPVAKPSQIDFFVRFPWGGSYMEQLMPALNRLKQPWVADPSAEGSDDYRIFLAKDKKKLRKAVKIIERAYEQANGQADEDEADSIIETAESQVLYEIGVSSIAHDWKHWDWEEDVRVLASLGIDLVVAELTNGAFRVRLKWTGEENLVRKSRKAREFD